MAAEKSELDPLLEAACAQDAAAFDALVAGLRPGLRRSVRAAGSAVFGPEFDEDDAVQVTLDKAWRLLPQFELRDRAAFERWLRALARGVLADRGRYRRARGRGGVRHLESILGQAGRLPAEDGPVSSAVRRKEALRRATRALRELRSAERVVVELHVLETLSLSAIAARLGLSKNAVFERLHRGLAQLRRSLGRELAGSSGGDPP